METLLANTFYHPKYGQFLRFAFIGGSCFVLEMILFIYLKNTFGEGYIYFINSFAFSLAVVLNYIVSRFWVFEAGRYSVGKEFLAFVGVAVVALLMSNAILWVGINQLHMNALFSKLLAVVIVLIWNFIMKKYLVFKG